MKSYQIFNYMMKCFPL